jgi:two-component system chemotaxis sensor kinase CheA
VDETAEYLPMFLAEGREHLQELNLAVVRIEETPDDQATVDEIFRIAHSLKGMSATMGFAGMAALTHEMEDVFELLRQRRGGLERAAIDVLLECLDALEAAVDAIESDGAEAIAPEPLIARLRTLVRDDEAPAATPEVVIEPPPDLGELAQGRRVVQVVATLAADASIPSVRAYMVLSALAGLGETLACRPDPDELEGFSGTEVVAWMVSDRTDAELAEAAAAVVEVDDATALEAVPDAAVDHPESLDPASGTPSAPAAEPSRQASPRGHGGSSTVRVDAERLDQLMQTMGELVLNRTLLEGLAAHAPVPGLPQAMQALTRSSHALQAMVMQVRMIPVEAVLLRFPRLVRDLGVKLGKQVELELVGKDTELDRSVVDSLGDPLVHLIRNSLDHGLETPAEREAAGKPAVGHVEIAARHAGGNVILSVRDDGRGIAPERLDADLGERSGLGAVRSAIRAIGGELTLTSVVGEGTSAEIRLPLTLAIMSALLVHADGRPFAVPIDRIERTVRLADHPVRSVAGRRMLVMSDGVLPLICASERFGGSVDMEADFAVIMRGAGVRVAFAVSALDGQRELVTRPLPPEVAEGSALSGAAVLSDGQIALIVDCDAVAEGVA